MSAWASAALAIAVFAGCTSTSHRAPVEDRNPMARPSAVAPAAPASAASAADDVQAKPLPGIENAGKPGYYTVKPGDTLIRIGLETGQNWRDIARWNKLDNPNVLEVGQVMRVVPPGANANGVVVRPVLPSGQAEAPPARRQARCAAAAAQRRRAAAVATAGAARRPRQQRRAAPTRTCAGSGRPRVRCSRPSTKRRPRAWRSAARPATRCWPRPTAASSMPAPGCAATATSSSSSTTTPTSPPTRTTRPCW